MFFMGRAPIARYAQCVTDLSVRRAVRRFKEANHRALTGIPTRLVRPVTHPVFHFTTVSCQRQPFYGGRTFVPLPGRRGCNFFFLLESRKAYREKEITLSGGSLGSCVDEERSQLRELM